MFITSMVTLCIAFYISNAYTINKTGKSDINLSIAVSLISLATFVGLASFFWSYSLYLSLLVSIVGGVFLSRKMIS